MRALFVLAAIVALALAGDKIEVKLSFDAGLNLTDVEDHFAWRTTNADVFGKVLGFYSASCKADADDGAKAEADAIVAFGSLPTQVLNTLPFGVMAYGAGKAAVDLNLKDIANNILNGFDLTANMKGGVVAMVALGMQEMNEDNEAVGDFIPFTNPSIFDLKHSCDPKKIEDSDKNMLGLTCRFKPTGDGTGVTVTLLTSKIGGIVEYGHTPVSPRTYEMIIAIDDFEWKKKDNKDKNHVRLSFGLATLSGKGNVDGNTYVGENDDGLDEIYTGLSHYAVVKGDREEVDVSITSGTVGLNLAVKTVLSAAFAGKADFLLATVDFPKGAGDFIYDPAMGVGENIYDAGASTVALSVLVALICALVALF